MNEKQIIDVFMKACLAIRRMPDNARPARLKAINIGYMHEAADLKHQEPETLRRWNKPSEVSMISAAEELIKLEHRAKHRRALWGWAMAHAGGKPFKEWCRTEGDKGIHVETGRRRAKAAIETIRSVFARNDALHNKTNEITVLTCEPEKVHIVSRIDIRGWMDAEAAAANDCIIADWKGIRAARNAERSMRAR